MRTQFEPFGIALVYAATPWVRRGGWGRDIASLCVCVCPSLQSLRPNGVVVVKDNLCAVDEYGACLMDLTDNSALRWGLYGGNQRSAQDSRHAVVTRNDEYMRWLFEESGFDVLYDEKQQDWPEDNFELHTYLLLPRPL